MNAMVIFIYMNVINCGPGKHISLIIESDVDIAADDCETINPQYSTLYLSIDYSPKEKF